MNKVSSLKFILNEYKSKISKTIELKVINKFKENINIELNSLK